MYDFTTSSDRLNTNAEKYTKIEKLFHTNDVIPLWIADMDIDSPDFVIDAIKQRLNHPILGYEMIPQKAFEAQVQWINSFHNKRYDTNDILFVPSVVASLNIAIETFSAKGDSIIVQTPVYSPFFKSILNHQRELIVNPLIQKDDGKYYFDFDDFKKKIQKNTKMLILCNPHNPVGRAWKKEELEEILEICLEHNILIFSDEVHCDLVYKPYKHIPFSSLKKSKPITISAYGIGKTFNLSGMNIASVIIEDENLKQQYKKTLQKIHLGEGNSLAHVAMQSAYENGHVWIEALQTHLLENYLALQESLQPYEKYIKLLPIEATYLAWLDCKGMELNDEQLHSFFIQKAQLGLTQGINFGKEGSGFMRLNFAISKEQMKVVLGQLTSALKDFTLSCEVDKTLF